MKLCLQNMYKIFLFLFGLLINENVYYSGLSFLKHGMRLMLHHVILIRTNFLCYVCKAMSSDDLHTNTFKLLLIKL